MNNKISIRFFNDREVRAAWDDESEQWLFSVADIVGILTDSSNPRKYWSVLKNRLKQTLPELTTRCSQLKMTAADGKRYLTDCLNQKDILALVEVVPSQHAVQFIKWLTYSDDTIDGQSKKKAYALFESGMLASLEPGSVKCLQQIHGFLFGGLYDFAGKIRDKNIAKGGFTFANALYFPTILKNIENMPETTFDEIVDKYVEMNVAHPFMEGNGRSTRIWLDLMLKRTLKKCVDWSKVNKTAYLDAMRESVGDGAPLKRLLLPTLTGKINDREMFMKGIDYSYYYESDDSTLEPPPGEEK
jgi:cell filamentation protein